MNQFDDEEDEDDDDVWDEEELDEDDEDSEPSGTNDYPKLILPDYPDDALDHTFKEIDDEQRNNWVRTIRVLLLIVIIAVSAFGYSNLNTIIDWVKPVFVSKQNIILPEVSVPEPTNIPQNPILEVDGYLPIRMEEYPYEEPTFKDGSDCGTSLYSKVRVYFADTNKIEFITENGQVQILYYNQGAIPTRIELLPNNKTAVWKNGVGVKNCSGLLYVYQTLQIQINLRYPVENWFHQDACNLESYVPSGKPVISDEKTTVLGQLNDDGTYTLTVNYSDGYNFQINIDARTGYLDYKIKLPGTPEPEESGWWEYDFRGETLIVELGNGEYLFLYIPWPDGYPNQYMYAIGVDFAAGGCKP